MIIKVCGMRHAENIRDVEALGVDMMGFIFYPPSARFVCEMPDYMPRQVERVGVFVDEELEKVVDTATRFELDFLQLHGSESVDYCRNLSALGYRIIKAFPISDAQDIAKAAEYDGLCEYFIFDTRTPSVGGSGEHFDWSLLNSYTGNTPFLLSGGIGVDDILSLADFTHPQLAGYDLNSCFENLPAIKNVEKIEQFIKQLKSTIYE